jgi:hypothetical protein
MQKCYHLRNEKGCSKGKRFYPATKTRVARFFLVENTKTGKNIPNYHIITKWPQNISDGRKIDQIVIKYTKIFHSKTLQNLPKLGFLV